MLWWPYCGPSDPTLTYRGPNREEEEEPTLPQDLLCAWNPAESFPHINSFHLHNITTR